MTAVIEATETKVRPADSELIEVLLTPSPALYAEMGDNLAAIRRKLNLGPSVSNTEVIAVARRGAAATAAEIKREEI